MECFSLFVIFQTLDIWIECQKKYNLTCFQWMNTAKDCGIIGYTNFICHAGSGMQGNEFGARIPIMQIYKPRLAALKPWDTEPNDGVQSLYSVFGEIIYVKIICIPKTKEGIDLKWLQTIETPCSLDCLNLQQKSAINETFTR